jgi:tetratricopeptide (TPR) repeat protein
VPAGLWAEVSLADLKLGEGIESLFREKQAAQSKLRSAIQHYQAVIDEADDALLVARARYGLARAYESLGQLDEARKVYEQIVGSSATNAYISVAKLRLKDLERSSTQDFYAWFAKQEPVAVPPASDLLPGTPGEKLPFDSGSLGSPGGLNLSGDSLLNIPPLDTGTTGPLLTPQSKTEEKDGKDAKEPTDTDEKNAAKTGETEKDNGETPKDDAVKKEDKKDAQAKEESTTDGKKATADGEKASEKSDDQSPSDNADK